MSRWYAEPLLVLFAVYYICGGLLLVVLTIFFFYYGYIVLFSLCLVVLLYQIVISFDGSEFRIRTFTKSSFAKLMINVYQEYFPIKLRIEEENRDELLKISEERKIILGSHPHGMISIATEVFVGEVAGLIFKIPFARHINCRWFDFIDASSTMAKKALDSEEWNIIISIGGVKEQVLANKDSNIVYVKNRRGFIKLGMKYGCCLVPSYSFGETELYNQYHWMSWFMNFRLWIAGILGIPLIIPFGRSLFLPFFPKRIPINVCLGKPILIPKCGEEDIKNEKIVNEYLDQYIQGLKDLFENNKNKYGYENRKLIVM